MAKRLLYNMNERGISGVVAAVLMIALVMAVSVIVWVVVRNVVQGQIGSVESCFGIYDKVKLNNFYTCYDTTNGQFQFSINLADIEVDSVIVSIAGEGTTQSYTLTNEDQSLNIKPYPSGSGAVKLPPKNGGSTYILVGDKPDSIEIAPVIGRQQCEISASLYEIESCI